MNTTKNGVEFKACGCGCEEAISPKSTYKPGHDARHAGQVARHVASLVKSGAYREVLQAGAEFGVLPSQALREKSARMAQRLVEPKPERKPRPTKATEVDNNATKQTGTGEIKIGRWTYPVRMLGVGKVERNEKRDGSGAWLPVSGNAAQNIDWA